MADTDTARMAAMHHRLASELDELTAGGILLDAIALRRLRDLLDEAIPVADAYAERVAGLLNDAVA